MTKDFFPKSTIFEEWNVPVYIWVSGLAQCNSKYTGGRGEEPQLRRLALILVTAGNIVLLKDRAEYKAEKGQVLAIPPSGDKQWKTGPAGLLNYRYVEIAGPSLESIMRSAGIIDKMVISPIDLPRITALFKASHQAFGLSPHERLYSLADTAFKLILELGKSIFYTPLPLPVRAAIDLMKSRIYGMVESRELSSAACLSVSRLNDLFRDHIHMPPLRFFHTLKIEHARHMLLDPTVSIKQIAYMLGYENQFYFSRVFRKVAGMSPAQYRRTVDGAALR
jgi:AraC-like DNA-binding protein